jgi:hypothetical protein
MENLIFMIRNVVLRLGKLEVGRTIPRWRSNWPKNVDATHPLRGSDERLT